MVVGIITESIFSPLITNSSSCSNWCCCSSSTPSHSSFKALTNSAKYCIYIRSTAVPTIKWAGFNVVWIITGPISNPLITVSTSWSIRWDASGAGGDSGVVRNYILLYSYISPKIKSIYIFQNPYPSIWAVMKEYDDYGSTGCGVFMGGIEN